MLRKVYARRAGPKAERTDQAAGGILRPVMGIAAGFFGEILLESVTHNPGERSAITPGPSSGGLMLLRRQVDLRALFGLVGHDV